MRRLVAMCTVLGLVVVVSGLALASPVSPVLVITADPAVAAVEGPGVPYRGWLAITPVAFTAGLTYDGGFGRGGTLSPWNIEGDGLLWADFLVQVEPGSLVTAGNHVLITLTDAGSSWSTVDMGLGELRLTDYSKNLFGTLYVIPEPATIVLLGLGALSLLRRK